MVLEDLKTDQRIIRLSVAGILFLIILVSIYFDPAKYKITDCSFKHLTGVSCPGCGLTRSFHAGANFYIAEAFAFHLLGPFFLLGFCFMVLKYLAESITGKTIQLKNNRKLIKTTLLIIGITWAGFWLSRMVYELL